MARLTPIAPHSFTDRLFPVPSTEAMKERKKKTKKIGAKQREDTGTRERRSAPNGENKQVNGHTRKKEKEKKKKERRERNETKHAAFERGTGVD